MTILGYRTTMSEAVVWTDSEVMKAAGTHCHFRNKMSINPLAGAVLVTTGWVALAETADRVFAGARDIDEVADILPKRLRSRTIDLLERRYGLQQAGQQRIYLIGHSSVAGRLVAYEFHGDNWFEPRLDVRGMSPTVAGSDLPGLPGMLDVIAIAGEQMRALQETYPHAEGGMLTVAHIKDGMVTTRPVHDLRKMRLAAEELAPLELEAA